MLKCAIDIPSEEARVYILEEVSNKQWIHPIAKTAVLEQPSASQFMQAHAVDTAPVVIEIQPQKANFVKYRFTIHGMWVDTWVFADGGVSVKCVNYHADIVALLKQWSREGGGSYSQKFKSWRYSQPFANTVLVRLQQLDTTPTV